MDEFYPESVGMQVLDFATDKRTQWEQDHQLYSVIFELTPRCNLNCVHCYLHDHHAGEELPFQRVRQIIDLLYEKQVLFLTFTGGEIFARKDFLDIYLYAKKKGFIIELYTNGVLIDDEALRVLEKYPPLLVDISLYGACEQTYRRVTGAAGAFQRVMDNIRRLRQADIRVSLKAPVLDLYYEELPQMQAIAEQFGLPFRTAFEIFPTIDNDKSSQQYRVSLQDALRHEFSRFSARPPVRDDGAGGQYVDLVEAAPLFRCKLGRASCVIDFQGRMCPCMSFRHAGRELTEENFDEIWKSFRQYPAMHASPSYRCLRCEAWDYCDICPAMMQFVHGDPEYVDEHFCACAKARYRFYELRQPMEQVLQSLPR